MSQGFVSATLVALGPFIVPLLLAVLAGAAWACAWLIYTGVERRIWWRVILGAPIAVYLAMVFASAVLFVG